MVFEVVPEHSADVIQPIPPPCTVLPSPTCYLGRVQPGTCWRGNTIALCGLMQCHAVKVRVAHNHCAFDVCTQRLGHIWESWGAFYHRLINPVNCYVDAIKIVVWIDVGLPFFRQGAVLDL